MTTFYIGGIENSKEIRSQLEEINVLIRSSETIPYGAFKKADTLPYTFNLLQGLAPPMYILKEPLLAELFGAGFTKAPKSRHYELRFPRISKIHRRSDRPWTEGVNLKDLHKIACAAVGRDTSDKEARDITAEIWGIPASPGAHSALKRKATMDLWREKLAALDERVLSRDNASRSAPPSPAPASVTTPPDFNSEVVLLPPAKKPRLSQEEWRSDIKIVSRSPRAAEDTAQPLRIRTNIVVNQPIVSSGYQQSQRSNLGTLRSPPLTPQKSPQRTMHKAGTSSQAFTCVAPVCNQADPNSGSRFLQNALIWFAKPCGESWAVKNTVQRGQRVHSVEALLAGCGWCANSRGANWVEKGVIFVDEDSAGGKEIARRASEMINDRSQVLPPDRPRKRIWIFDRKRWTLDDEVKVHALYQYD
ncbi:hypothetical protein C0995_008043 [Termitomyces sp. Mi166|nr:hypothetical protein C0995_008043 [Termitomyces sp. Mi166\